MPETILVAREGRVAIITINRPDKLNALSQQVRDEMLEVLAEIEKDDSVGVVVVTGAGEKSFIAGADIGEFAGRTPMDQREAMASPRIFDIMANFPKPVIAMINGFCLGGGCELAMSCDIRIASDKARFGQPEVNLGLIPGFGGTIRLAERVGIGWARRLIYTGEIIDAARALELGLVDMVVPPNELLPTARALAEQIATKAPLAVAAAKRSLLRARRSDPAQAADHETLAFSTLFASADAREGLEAFVQKRKAEFKGR